MPRAITPGVKPEAPEPIPCMRKDAGAYFGPFR